MQIKPKMLNISSDSNIIKKKSISDLFSNKSSLEKILDFMTPKEKFRLLCNSKRLQKEYDSKIDDFFVPRKYQKKIKNYNKNYEDLFYQVLNDIKKEKEKNGEKIFLYEIENDFIKYLKYLTRKYNKIIKLSLIDVNSMEIWKLEFISKVLENLEKNIHLKIKFVYSDLKQHDIFNHICRYSKAINAFEIIEVSANRQKNNIYNEDIVSIINWDIIKKISINLGKKNDANKADKFLIKFINSIEKKNCFEFELNCDFINFYNIGKFIEKNAKHITRMKVDNYKFNNETEIQNNSILKYFETINDLSLSTDESNLNKLLYFFYPLFPKIKKFNLIINEDENENENKYDDETEKKESEKKNKKKDNINKNKIKKGNKTKNNIFEKDQIKFCFDQLNLFYSEICNIKEDSDSEDITEEENSDFEETRNINMKKFSFTTEKNQEENKLKKKKKKGKKQNYEKDNFFVSTLSNLNNCESLIYEIKKDNSNGKMNYLSYLMNVLETNKNNLKHLEIYINNNNENTSIDLDDFAILIQKISACKNLNLFIFECELYDEYASLFNDYFKIGNNLTHLSLVHSIDLDIMKIINEHPNLTNIKFELISQNVKKMKEISKSYKFNLDSNREWKSIELINYPINQDFINFLRSKNNIFVSLNLYNNISDVSDQAINEILDKLNDNKENNW